ncbi:hypothetical protein Sste5346_000048 [Sporothrix stenoceras]|uniref:carboxypeptidase C n=1 Tax=Sporothrix stenoceras TaxID=5173 RepID=A0ABR3ZTL6_9PEZI
MHLTTALALAGAASASVLPPILDSIDSRLDAQIRLSPSAPPLKETARSRTSATVASSPRPFSIREQGDDVCRAGTRQYSGQVNVTDDKSLFFWFFESRNNAADDPVILWLNGGPGGSSMYGLFEEIGACLLNEFNNDTYVNEHSWANYANLLFLDQPAGVGFSSDQRNGSIGPNTLEEAAADFAVFLDTFLHDVFPQLAGRPLHIAGESFGGSYVPYFTSRLLASANVPDLEVESIILVDATVDGLGAGVLGYYDHLCAVDEQGHRKTLRGWLGGLNETACAAMERDMPRCEQLNVLCLATYDLDVCAMAAEWCMFNLGIWLYSDVVSGGRNPYDDRRPCNNPPMCDDFSEHGYSEYLNRADIQAALGIAANTTFEGVNLALNTHWLASKNMFRPTTREVTYLLDQTPARVLVVNGNNDIIVNTEGQKRVYDNLPWSKQALYRISSWVDWVWPDTSSSNKDNGIVDIMTVGGQIKTAGKLSFATVAEAGHASPADQKPAVSFLVHCWITNGKSDPRCPQGM